MTLGTSGFPLRKASADHTSAGSILNDLQAQNPAWRNAQGLLLFASQEKIT
jgi:hypothetical protein